MKPGCTLAVFVLLLTPLFAPTGCAQTPPNQPGSPQTVTLNYGSVLQANPYRYGMNLESAANYGNAQVMKNLLATINWNEEPFQLRSHYVILQKGTQSSFEPNNTFAVAANRFVGATYVVDASVSGNTGCTGTIISNTTGTLGKVAPTYTLSNPCPAPLQPGDQVTVSFLEKPTPEAVWAAGQNASGCHVSGNAHITGDVTAPIDGQQSIILDTSAGGSAQCVNYLDNGSNQDSWLRLNGTYKLSFRAKSIRGNGKPFYVQLYRMGGSACTVPMSVPATTATTYSTTCTFAERNDAHSQALKLQYNVNGNGTIEFDDFVFEKIDGDSTNKTVYRDEVVKALRDLCGDSGPTCTIRNWMGNNGMSFDNYILPAAHALQSTGGWSIQTSGVSTPQLPDMLALIYAVHGTPYLLNPVTFSNKEDADEVDYLLGTDPANPYVKKRIASCKDNPQLPICKPGGVVIPWAGPKGLWPRIFLTSCNECWNYSTFNSQNIPQPNYASPGGRYGAYALRTGAAYAAMHASPSYNSGLQLGFDLQEDVAYDVDKAISAMAAVGGAPDYIEQGGYRPSNIQSLNFQTIMEGPWAMVNEPNNLFRKAMEKVNSLHLCGKSGKAPCYGTTYEQGNGMSYTTPPMTQEQLDIATAGAVDGIAAALQFEENQNKLGMVSQNFFGMTGYNNKANNNLQSLIWAGYVDFGGAMSLTNKVPYIAKPGVLATMVANQGIIGATTACSMTSPTFNQEADKGNGPTGPLPNVPYLTCYASTDGGGNRAITIINTDLTHSYPIRFSGTDTPKGPISLSQYAPADLNAMNQAHFPGYTGDTMMKVFNTSGTVTSFTAPPHSVSVLRYSTGGTTPPRPGR